VTKKCYVVTKKIHNIVLKYKKLKKEKDEKVLIEAKVKEIEENKAKAEEQALKEMAKELT
jgi:hypothetical protein